MTSTVRHLLIAILGMIIACAIFYFPSMQGKTLSSGDNLSSYIACKETRDYEKKGIKTYWTKVMFSGMPNFTLGAQTNNNFIGNNVFNFFHGLPYLFGHMLFMALCMFFALKLLNIKSYEAAFFAIAFSINTWVVDSLVNGHVTKMVTYGNNALVFISFVYFMMTKRNLWALLAFLLGLTINIALGHIQVSYYLILMLIIAGLFLLYWAVKDKTTPDFFKKIAAIIVCSILAIIANSSYLYNLYDYSKETMRGGKTELTPIAGQNSSTNDNGGLNFDYAMSWSYKFTELFNFIVPNAMGGSSNYEVKSSESEVAKLYNQEKVALPMYWGGQPFTSGPNYIGAIIMFLFVFYLFYTQDKVKWMIITISIFSICMGLGKYFAPFNEFLFNNLPMYNKFRTPTMAFSMINMLSIVGAALLIREIWNGGYDKDRLFKSLKSTGIFFGVVIVIFTVMISNQGFDSPNDASILQQNPDFPLDKLRDDRESLFRSDLFRAIFLMGLTALAIWAIINDKIKSQTAIYILMFVSVADLWLVSKRYYSNDIFVNAPDFDSLIPYEPYDQTLQADPTYFRMFNTTVNSFNDNTDGYKFANVGGYSPAKLYRYQDLIDRQLSKGNQAVYNMLNTKYFIMDAQGQKVPQTNAGACGPAWFVRQVQFVPSADSEMNAMNNFVPQITAVVDQRYKSDSKFDGVTDTSSKIDFVSYSPDTMRYTSHSKSGGFAVFSEVWYRGNTEWKVFVDGVEQKMVRTNYLLRGTYLPAGDHRVEFIFAPQKFLDMLKVSTIGTIIVLLLSLFLGWQIYQSNKKIQNVSEK